jgi:hypothetical protein
MQGGEVGQKENPQERIQAILEESNPGSEVAVVGYFSFNCREPDGMQRVNIYISVKRTLLVSLFLCIITLRLISFANFSHSLAESNDFRFIHSDIGLLRETESLPGGPIKNHPVAATKIIANIPFHSF